MIKQIVTDIVSEILHSEWAWLQEQEDRFQGHGQRSKINAHDVISYRHSDHLVPQYIKVQIHIGRQIMIIFEGTLK